jgi:hypothetical protein
MRIAGMLRNAAQQLVFFCGKPFGVSLYSRMYEVQNGNGLIAAKIEKSCTSVACGHAPGRRGKSKRIPILKKIRVIITICVICVPLKMSEAKRHP